ncbi:trimeric intracellular cation channel family protein [Noviherbaspirillum suwonense]|jgi:uncharacterized membrane protein YeiH|uniref:Uncharacterized membrane protein YeiH n=1 Tax=Noviherbaspirillum suwonense TaxID=1224511 RepID=A0ABY1Q2V7_9BURK|nr:trimeric intracellular cation channel family protein [Noviherbaspirillum suwonense]SMP57571.1 Uncharacterized membrane protein YeiH [Noviherbaspirillum suwonense]
MAIAIQVNLTTLLKVIEVLGIVAFACSGFIEARRRDMDMVGIFTVGFITAFGGGTLRDLLLDQRPLFWVERQEYVLLIFVLALVITPFTRHISSGRAEKVILLADALGLGLFSVLGTSIAEDAKMPLFVCVMMGVITGIFGGVLRDVLCNEIPLVLRRGQLYATCAFFGCWVSLLLDKADAPEGITLGAGIGVTCVMRLLAVRFNLKLPA